MTQLAMTESSSPLEQDVAERPALPPLGETALLVREDLKPALLEDVLHRGGFANALVFTRTRHRANTLADWLTRAGLPAERIHGNRTPAQRAKALADFAAGERKVLVVTDLAAVGTDFAPVGAVVHFDLPANADEYLQRLTAREPGGAMVTLIGELELKEWQAVERVLPRSPVERYLDDFDYDAAPQDDLFGDAQPPRPEARRSQAPAGPGGGGAGHGSQAASAGRKARRRRKRGGTAGAPFAPPQAGGHRGGPPRERTFSQPATATQPPPGYEDSLPRGLFRRPGDRPGPTHVPAAFRNRGSDE